jgi:hypothetical protein
MLMNYPKEELKRLLDDPTFLEEQNILKMHEEKTKSKPRANSKSNDVIESRWKEYYGDKKRL